MSEEKFIDDEAQEVFGEEEDEEEEEEEEVYLNSENDPQKVLIVPEDDYVINDNEKVAGFDKVFEFVKAKITDLTKYDKMMEEKLLDALRRGDLK